MSQPEGVEILLVEDSEHEGELMLRALKNGGLANSLLWVKDGQEAADYCLRQGKYADYSLTSPRLVLLDLNMPKMGGLEFLEIIRSNEKTKKIPVVVMTSSEE